jgi:DNA-binding IclR family transcriptional regulator
VAKSKQSATEDNQRRYRAPALERGLDILELLSAKSKPVSQSKIAEELNRSSSEVFRMLSCLVDRGYVARSVSGDGFIMTMKLHRLAANWPLVEILIEAALPEMYRLAERAGQSVHLGVYSAGRMVVTAEAQSSSPVGISVRIGSEYSLLHTASGRVLLTWQPSRLADHWIRESEPNLTPKKKREIDEYLHGIRERGYEFSNSDIMHGLTDISFPILNTDGYALAALTVPFLQPLKVKKKIEAVVAMVRESAEIIHRNMTDGTH